MVCIYDNYLHYFIVSGAMRIDLRIAVRMSRDLRRYFEISISYPIKVSKLKVKHLLFSVIY